MVLFYSIGTPLGPPVGGPPWGGRAAGGAKKCTFFWVFNNSPSRDNLKFFFPRGPPRDPHFGPPRTPHFGPPPGPCLSVPRQVGWNAWRDGTPTPNGAGGTCPHVTQPPSRQGTAVPRSEVSDRMMTAQRSERVIMAERPTERKTLKCPSARDQLLGKGLPLLSSDQSSGHGMGRQSQAVGPRRRMARRPPWSTPRVAAARSTNQQAKAGATAGPAGRGPRVPRRTGGLRV